MSNHIACEDFREQVQDALSEEGKCFTLPEKTLLLLHKHGQKCEECRKWAEEFTRIPLTREQEDFLSEIFRRERKLSPVLCWSFWSLGLAGGIALLCGVFFYLEERMSPEVAPGVKMEEFASAAELAKQVRREKELFARKKKELILLKEKKNRDLLPEKVEYATIAFPLYLFASHQKPEAFFKAYLGKCRIYMIEKAPSGKAFLVHVPKKEEKRFADLKRRLLRERKNRR